MSSLKITVESHCGTERRELVIDDFPFHIGRTLDNDLSVPFPSISGRHAVIDLVGPHTVDVVDLHSTNGTTVDGIDLVAHRAHTAELPVRLKLGDLMLVVEREQRQDLAFTVAESSTQLRKIADDKARRALQNEENTQPFFEVLEGSAAGRRHYIEAGDVESTIGAGTDHDVVLPVDADGDPLGTIVWRGDDCWLLPECDRFVYEGEPVVDETILRSGNRLSIDDVELLFFDPLEKTLQALRGDPEDSVENQNDETSTSNTETKTPATNDDAADEGVSHRAGAGAAEIALLVVSVLALVLTVGLLWMVFFAA